MSGNFSAEAMVVDDTTVTSLLQRPLDWGAAASLYSLTSAMRAEIGLTLARGPALEVP